MKGQLAVRAGHWWVACCAVAAMSSSACSVLSSGWERGENLATNMVFPTAREKKLGRQVSSEFEAQVKIHSDPAVQAYITELGESLVAQARDRNPDIEFKFQVIDDLRTVNALAMPGGYIYVYSGLIVMSQSESELAAVLGHEVAHVTQRHVLQRLTAVYGLESLQDLLLDGNTSLVAQIAGDMLSNGVVLKYSRVHESDADDKGMDYLVRAGFSPQGFVTFFEKLATAEDKTPEFMSSHPLPQRRIKAARERIAGMTSPPTMQTRDEAAFDAFKAAVIAAP